jgi:tetratricopeptide (TPR) repeat protein
MSPFRNVAVGDMHLSDGRLDAAEHHYRRSVELLPEYTAAHYGLGYLYRRLRRTEASSLHLRLALLCPLVFWGGSFWADHILPGSFRNDWARKALYWIQQIKAPDPSLTDDPFYRSMSRLTLKTGLAKSEDVDVLMSVTDEYEVRGDYVAASLIWMNVGERGAMETTAFRERYALTPASYATRLSRLWRSAGIVRRADLLDRMVTMMKKPDGKHL